MKKLSLTLFAAIMLLSPLSLQAQSGSPERYKKALYAEAFGQGLQGGLHYDMRLLSGRQDGPGFRAGLGGTFTGSSDAGAGPVNSGLLGFPVGINYLLGEKRSALEAGLGLMPLYARTDLYSPTKPKIVNENGWSTPGFMNLGYRFQPIDNGFIFRLAWTPLISGEGFISRFGLSAGYAFN